MRTRLPLLLLAALVAVLLPAGPALADHANGVQTQANRSQTLTSGSYRLIIISSGYNTPGNDDARGLSIMETEHWDGSAWVNSTSQSITLNGATLYYNGNPPFDVAVDFGQDSPMLGNCRRGSIQGPTGTVGCSTANLQNMYYYSEQVAHGVTNYQTQLWKVSARFANGVPVTWTVNKYSGVWNSG